MTNTQVKEPKLLKEQKDYSETQCKTLFEDFVHYKNGFIKEKEHLLEVDDVVYEYLNILEEKWKWTCRANNSRKNSILKMNFAYFRSKCMMHIEAHKKIVFLNFIGKKIEELGLTPNQEITSMGYAQGWTINDIIFQHHFNEIYMHLIEIPELNEVYKFPSNITELSPKQFLDFISLSLQFESGAIDMDEFLNLFVVKLLDLKWTAKFAALSQENKTEIASKISSLSALLLSFFRTETNEGKVSMSLNLEFVTNLLPKIKNLYGPKDALADISWGEYSMAHYYFEMWIKEKNPIHLNYLAAVLYRRKRRFLGIIKNLNGYNGQERVKFNPNTVESRGNKLRLSYAEMYGIMLFFNGCENFLAKGEPVINGRAIDLKVLYDNNGEESASGNIGLTGVLYALSETGVFGTIKETNETNLYDILARLYQVRCQSLELESKYKSNAANQNL